MKKLAQNYYSAIHKLLENISVTKQKKSIDLDSGISEVAKLIQLQSSLNKKLIFIGNGASAAISSHQATDFWKNGGIKAVAFNDASLLTCISNDFGYEYVFQKPIEMFAEEGDVLIAISSSGRSKNIINAVEEAKKKGLRVITLSGFQEQNPLRQSGEYNFYVPSSLYGHVEILHLSICHCLGDIIIQKKADAAFNKTAKKIAGDEKLASQKIKSSIKKSNTKIERAF